MRPLRQLMRERRESIDDRISKIVTRAKDANDAGLQTEATFNSILKSIDDVSASLEEADTSTTRMTGQFNELDGSIRDLRASAEDVKKAAELTENEIPVISEGFQDLENFGKNVMGSISQIDESTSRQVQNINQAGSTLDLLQDTINTLKKQISIFTKTKTD